jgi:DNA-binding MarR family transcriptional regulator
MSVSAQALEAARLLDRLQRLARAGELAGGLNPAQWDALRYLARANRFSRTPAALADYLASTRGTISRTLASLEDKGYVRRAESDRDGRSVEFLLTKKAADALRRDPLLAVAADIEKATGRALADIVESLRKILRMALARNDDRAFGVCASCRYFRAGQHANAEAPHHCALLDEPLSESDSAAICVEQEPRVA